MTDSDLKEELLKKDAEGDKASGGRKEEAAARPSGVSYTKVQHPSRSLELRAKGFGVGAGYERLYNPEEQGKKDMDREPYGAISHGGYYGAGTSARRFKTGQAGFKDELLWYRKQYGEKTSGYDEEK